MLGRFDHHILNENWVGVGYRLMQISTPYTSGCWLLLALLLSHAKPFRPLCTVAKVQGYTSLTLAIPCSSTFASSTQRQSNKPVEEERSSIEEQSSEEERFQDPEEC